MKGVAVFIASFGYVGFFPIAPGTAGSLAALALFAFIRWIGVPVIELAFMGDPASDRQFFLDRTADG